MRQQVILFIFALATLASCSKYNRTLKSPDYAKKQLAAEKYFLKKDYFRALTLYEQLQERYNGDEKGQEMLYYNAYCNYGLRNYTISAYLFKTYVENYPNGPRVEECYFLYATSLMKETYAYELDQTNTTKAIEEFKIFASLFPDSKYMAEINMNLDELRGKLAYKAYRNARLYYRIENYKAAILSLNNVLRDYPEIQQKEEIEFMILRSSFLLAKNSVEEKKQERLENTVVAFNTFIENYPQSKYKKEAESIHGLTLGLLKKYQLVKTN